MKIKHYSKRYCPEIQKRLQSIIEKSHKNRLDSNYATTYELLAEDNPHARDSNLEIAKNTRETVSKRKEEIEKDKEWIERKAPGFFKRMAFVQKYVVNWDLDMPAICYPLKITDSPRKTHTRLTSEQRQQSLSRRKDVMTKWYCFFFGTKHLGNYLLESL